MSDQTPQDLMNEVNLEEIRNRLKSDPVKVAKMWMRYLATPLLALLGLIGVAAVNIPSFTAANQQLMDTMATMHPWKAQSHPSWSVQDVAPSSRYLRMEFVRTAFIERIFELGWTNVGTDMMFRVRVPNAIEGELDIKYYSSWIGTPQRVGGTPVPPEGEEADRSYALRFSQHNLPPAGPPDGALVDGASYQCVIKLLMESPDGNFYREYEITTDWYEYVATP